MLPMRRLQRQRSPGETACGSHGAWIGLVVAGALAFASGTAAAQTTTPAPQAAPLEAGDTAPPPGAPPPALAEPLTPLPLAAEAPALTAPLVVPAPPAPRHVPIYRKDWFWGAVGVLVLTGAIVLAVSLSNADPATPSTRLGDMRAF
jgi:hypothetical protein